MNQSKTLAILFLVCLACTGLALAQSWQPLHDQPTFGASISLLLTDGTVMVQDVGAQDWWQLTPDETGSYVNGTWTQLASLPPGYSPYAFASAVLADGRVIVEGGEYNFFQIDWTTQGAIYDPQTNVWTVVTPPGGWNTIGDAESVVLPDGTFMVANCCSFPFLAALLNEKTLGWTPTGANKQDSYDEEGWTLLPDGTVLTVDTENSTNPTHAEKYIPRSAAGSARGARSYCCQTLHGGDRTGGVAARWHGVRDRRQLQWGWAHLDLSFSCRSHQARILGSRSGYSRRK